jgi:hydrogenase maturation protease
LGAEASRCKRDCEIEPQEHALSKTLIIGYGNPDREDDGVAWHVLDRLAERLGRPAPAQAAEDLEHGGAPDLLCRLQLDPDLAEAAADYDRVCFVDAHTGAYAEDVRVEEVAGEFQTSPFTHHMTPQTVLALVATLHERTPQGIVVSVRGYRFGFARDLSPATAQLAEAATERIMAWLSAEERV